MQDFEAQVGATDEAVRLVDEAAAALDAFAGGRLNGFGLFADPSMQRMHLVAAGRAVTAALAAMDGTRWPSAAEMREARPDGCVASALYRPGNLRCSLAARRTASPPSK